MPITKKTAEAKLGRMKGYSFRNTDPPNRFGCLTAGRAKAPPKAGPKILPMVQTSGMTLKARGWSSFSGTISATMVRMMPTFPFMSPRKARAVINIPRDFEDPNTREKIIVKKSPVRMMGFRPKVSDAAPQGTAMVA